MNMIGTLGQQQAWDIYNPATFAHPMVPYDVLVDPVSMPTHPILDIKMSNGGSIGEFSEEELSEEEEETKEKIEEKEEKIEEKEEKKVGMERWKDVSDPVFSLPIQMRDGPPHSLY